LVGDILRKRREELGYDLREIAGILKIRYDYLKAIEDATLENLPEEVYVKGYIRAYAEHLKIDPESAINAYIQQISPSRSEDKEDREKIKLQQKKINSRYAFISIAIVLFAIMMSYIFFSPSPGGKNVSLPVKDISKELTLPPSENKKVIHPDENERVLTTTPIELNKTTTSLPSEPKKQDLSEADKFLHILEIHATDTTWLSVDIDKTYPKEILMKPGESLKFQAKNAFSLIIGNAGGIRLLFDKKEMGTLGEKGQVIKINLPDSRI
jgi:hypothetical protein